MTFQVTYDKKTNEQGSIIVRASDKYTAIARAKAHCHTGCNFRNAVQVDDSLYSKPRKQGFYGK